MHLGSTSSSSSRRWCVVAIARIDGIVAICSVVTIDNIAVVVAIIDIACNGVSVEAFPFVLPPHRKALTTSSGGGASAKTNKINGDHFN
jgi:hypothetical protein